MGRIPERAIVCRSKFCTVCHNGDMFESVFIQSSTNCRHASIHHIGRRNDVGTSLCQCHAHFRQQRQGFIIQDMAALYQTAVSMGSIFAQAHISNDQKFGIVFLDPADGSLGDPIGMICLRSHFVFFRRNAKNQHTADAAPFDFHQQFIQSVDGILIDPGHGIHGMFDIFPLHNENGIDHFFRGNSSLSDQIPHSFCCSESSESSHFPTSFRIASTTPSTLNVSAVILS